VILKDQAEFFARTIETDLQTVSNVIAWVDENIMQLEQPPIWLLELSSMGRARRVDVLQALRNVEGVADETLVVRAFFGLILERVQKGILSPKKMSKFLYRMNRRYPEVQKQEIWRFDERYDDFLLDSKESLAEVDRAFVTFLERESGSFPSLDWSFRRWNREVSASIRLDLVEDIGVPKTG
jgi:hypothetical protein